MKNVLIFIAVVLAGLLIEAGLNIHARAAEIAQEKQALRRQNVSMSDELKAKQRYHPSSPQSMSEAFRFFINQTRMLEIYSGTHMSLVVDAGHDNDDMQEHDVLTEFRRVKGLRLMIHVDKFSNETDMEEVLNDIYLLEKHTDFKVKEIMAANGVLTVKGELYGI